MRGIIEQTAQACAIAYWTTKATLGDTGEGARCIAANHILDLYDKQYFFDEMDRKAILERWHWLIARGH